MKKKRRLKPKIRILITFIIAIILFGYVSYSAINYSISKTKFEKEEKVLKEKLGNLKDKEEDLNQEISKLKDDDYLARYAREEYLYSKDGEYVIKIEDKKEETTEEKHQEKSFVKYIIYGCIIIIIIASIIFILKLRKPKKDIPEKWISFIILNCLFLLKCFYYHNNFYLYIHTLKLLNYLENDALNGCNRL